jgi:outer membrane lipoprotein SlyB
MKVINIIFSIVILSFLTSCESSVNRIIKDDSGANTYSSLEAGKFSDVYEGTILSIKEVRISGSKGLGAAVGTAIGGGVAASRYDSTSGQRNAAIIGGLLGALAGSATEEAITNEVGYEFLLRMNDGSIKSFVQKSIQGLRVGDAVYVIYNGDIVRLTRK